MAENKKSFILYCDLINSIEFLNEDEVGRLFIHILQYVNDMNPQTTDRIIQIAFEPIKQQLKRDLKVWEGVKTVRSENGKLGGIKSGEARKKQKQANEANASKPKQKQANEAVTVNVTVTDTVTDTVNEIQNTSFDLFWKQYPNKVAKDKCSKKWDSLKQSERDEILLLLPDYLNFKPFAGYNHPNPETFFNQRRWEDEQFKKSKTIAPPVKIKVPEDFYTQSEYEEYCKKNNLVSQWKPMVW